MRRGPRIPVAIDKFVNYVNKTDDYLLAFSGGVQNYVRLGLTGGQVTDWHSKREFMRTDLFPRYNSEATKTDPVIKEFKNFRKAFRTFANPLLDIMSVNLNANETDESMLNFVIEKDNPSKPTTPIADECITALIPKTGAKMIARSRSEHDSKRSSVAEGATGVQYAYKIGGGAPVNPDDGTVKEFLSGSSHTLSFGVENVGKKIYIYSRWFNPSYPQFAGTWNDLQTGGIA